MQSLLSPRTMDRPVFRSLMTLAVGAAVAAVGLGCGGGTPMDAQAPASLSNLQRVQFQQGAEAKTTLDNLHMTSPGTTDGWYATYGDGDRVEIYAMAFPSAEMATASMGKMQTRLANGTSRYEPIESANIAQQPGWRTREKEDGKFIFAFTKGRWMIGIRAIALDLELAVTGIDWVAAK